MNKKMTYRWNLRQLMATRGMFATTDLVPLLAERGIHLSREQVFRLVTTTPQRLSLDTLAALCDILDVGVEDLIDITPPTIRSPKHPEMPQRRGRSRWCGAPPSVAPKDCDRPPAPECGRQLRGDRRTPEPANPRIRS